MKIRVISKENDSYADIDLDTFMFSNFELKFSDGSTLPRNDLMFYMYDYDYYIRLSSQHSWEKIDVKDFYV